MELERHKHQKEACSLDNVELESSDEEELQFDESQNNHLTNGLAVAKLAESSLDSYYKGSGEDDEEDINSDEERDILKGIKDEIESKVREEMKDELAVYKSRLQAIEAGKLPGDRDETKAEAGGEEGDQSEMDPKLKEAFVKMQKLDRILRKKVKREREVKRDRLILEKRLKDEIAEMKHGASNYKEIKTNTEKFLALAPPPSHNEGITLDYEEDEEMPPLFQTQIDDCEIRSKSKRNNIRRESADKDATGNISTHEIHGEDSKSRAESSASGDRSRKRNNSKKDFIKRNKELAAAANETIAMTDDEKKRLQDLLGDLDEMPELEDDTFDGDGTASSIFQLALNPGDGFIPDDIELKSLTSIDEKLKYILPEDDFASIAGTSQYSSPRPALFTRVGHKSNLLDGFGEQVLYETKEERELKARLESIEKKIEMFNAPKDTETGRSDCHLTDEQLDELLDQCARSMSRTSAVLETPDSSARSEVSSRLTLMVNPPKLSEDQLQKLLAEAYFPMSSQLASLSEDAGEDSAISAEAWKAIVDQRLEGDEDENNEYNSNDDSDEFSSKLNNLEEPQNISQNAHFNKNHDSSGSFDMDNLLLSGKDEIPGKNNSVNNYREDSLSHRSQSKSKDFKGFPKISTGSSLSMTTASGQHQSSSTPSMSDNNFNHRPTMSSSSSSNLKQEEESSDPLRLPSISSNSFLIHASQGLNNKSLSSRGGAPSSSSSSTRDPIPMVRNNLSDMSLTSFTDESFDTKQNQNQSQVQQRRSSDLNSRKTQQSLLAPKPPAKNH